MQLIFISIVKSAFFSFKDRPATLFDGETSSKLNSKPSETSNFHSPDSLKSKLNSNFHSEIRSQRAFKQLILTGLKTPLMKTVDETEENTLEVINEMEQIAQEVVSLMYDLKAKASENREEVQVVNRLKELVKEEIPEAIAELEMMIM